MEETKPASTYCKNASFSISCSLQTGKNITFVCDDKDCQSCTNYYKNIRKQIQTVFQTNLKKANEEINTKNTQIAQLKELTDYKINSLRKQYNFVLKCLIILLISFVCLIIGYYFTQNDSCNNLSVANIDKNTTIINLSINETINNKSAQQFAISEKERIRKEGNKSEKEETVEKLQENESKKEETVEMLQENQSEKFFEQIKHLINFVLKSIQQLGNQLISLQLTIGLRQPKAQQTILKLKLKVLKGLNKQFYDLIEHQNNELELLTSKLIDQIVNIVTNTTCNNKDKVIPIEEQVTKIKKQISVQTGKKNIQNLLISKKFEHFLKETKAKIQSYELKFRLSGLIITQQQQLDILQVQSKELFNELKNNPLGQFTKFEESALKRKQQNVGILSTHQFIELISELESEANAIINQFIEAIEDNIHLQIMNFEIYSLQKLNFFSKKIKELNLLYKASENYFQISKFWDKCSGKPHTLVLIRTQFDKIIGGYTPMPWNKTIDYYQKDESKESFIFSITEKHKLKLISGKQKYAIQHRSTSGPTFGEGYDIYISDKAHQYPNSYADIGSTYNNGDYFEGNQQSHKKFSGQTKGQNFKILEWAVYEIVFE